MILSTNVAAGSLNADYLSVIVAFLALIISILTFLLYCFEYRTNKREKIKNNAPVFTITSVQYLNNLDNREYKYPKAYLQPKNSNFILEKRFFKLYNEKGEVVEKGSGISLIINACSYSSNLKKISLINMNKISIANIGNDVVLIEIKKITINIRRGGSIVIKPSTQNKIFKRVTITEPLELYVSIICDSESGLYDFTKASGEEFLKLKKELIDGELLNAKFEDMADLWQSIVLEVESKTPFNTYYSQSITVKIVDYTYLADQTEPELIENANING